MAHLLGAARNGVHDVVSLSADRGGVRNEQVHVLGAAADLVVLRVLLHLDRDSQSTRWFADSLLVERERVSSFAPGLELADGPMEVRAVNVAYNNPWLKVNEAKHKRLQARQPPYVFVCLQMHAKLACICRPVLWSEVDGWPVRHFPQHHSAALYQPLRDVADGVRLPKKTVGQIRGASWQVHELDAARKQAEANLAVYVPGWRRLRSTAVVAG
jgi:hypothetical protein